MRLTPPPPVPEKSQQQKDVSSQTMETGPAPAQPAPQRVPEPPASLPSAAATAPTESPNDDVGSKRHAGWDVDTSEKRAKSDPDDMDLSDDRESSAHTQSSKSKAKKGVQVHRVSGPKGTQKRLPVPDVPRSEDPNATVLTGHGAEVFALAWNPTVPNLLASGAGDATVRIWDLSSSGEEPAVCKHLPPTQAKNVSTVAWNPDGTLLASGSYDGILRLWTPQGDLHLVMSMHQGAIFAVRWNRKGNMLLTGSADGTAIVWDVSSGRTRQQFSLHSDNVLDVQWLTGDIDSQVAHPNPSVADAVFATCSADNSVQICKVGEPKPLKSLVRHTDEVNSIRFDPSQSLLASASDDGVVHVWVVDVPGVATCTLDKAPSENRAPARVLQGHKEEVYALAWSPTGPGSTHPDQPRMLASASFDHTARLWNVDTGDCIHVIDKHERSVYALCFSPCARYLATGGIDHRVLVTRISVRDFYVELTIQDGEPVYEYVGGGPVMDLVWHARSSEEPRGSTQQLAVALADKALVVLDLTASV